MLGSARKSAPAPYCLRQGKFVGENRKDFLCRNFSPACTDDRDALCALPVIQRQKGDISGCGILSVQPKTSPSHPTILHSRGRAVGSSAQARPSQPLLNRNCRLEKPSRKGCVARRPLLKPRRHLDRVFCDLTYRCAVFRTKVCLRAIHPFRRIFSPAVPL